MSKRQSLNGGTVLAKCVHCLYSRQTWNVSAKVFPPHGGHLCEDCLIPAAIEAQAQHAERIAAEEVAREEAKRKAALPQIKCPECGMVSYNENDIKMGYCGNCSWWTSDPIMRKVPKKDRA